MLEPMKKQVLARHIQDARPEFEEMLREFVEIPSVSADPKHADDIRQTALLAANYLRRFGAKTQIHETRGNPVVVGKFLQPGAKRTLTIYNHLDVQPADEPEWERAPFTFVKKKNQYYGRGATDDKGPALTALFATRYAMASKIPLNIQFVWELEEEIGSPHFEEFLKKNSPFLKSDSTMVVDSIWISKQKPSICYGLRGNLTGSMILETAKAGVHSGLTGGLAKNPLAELCTVASRCFDVNTGKILIPGFYDDVVKISEREKRNFDRSGFNLKQYAAAYGLKKYRRLKQSEAMIRMWCMPTFEVHGLVGGYTGPGIKTAIPPRAELKFSCRLVSNQDPAQISDRIRQFVRKINPDVKLKIHAMLQPYVGNTDSPYGKAIVEAMKFGFSMHPVFVRSGGSDGAIILLYRYLKGPVMMPGLSLPEHGYHAPNEYFDWGQVSCGFQSFVHYFNTIARF